MAVLFLCLIYMSFISLGLPDSMLGAAWPAMRQTLHAPLGQAGSISLMITAGTVVSSLVSSRMIRRFGTGKVTAVSVTMTAAALLGVSFVPSVGWMYLLAIPMGLGAGSVDAGLNGYVAKHYAARHMNWLHCFWGLGATIGPAIMAAFVARGNYWQGGYRTVSAIQFALSLVLFLSLPLWQREAKGQKEAKASRSMSVLRMPAVRWTLFSFFLYCSLELGAGLWCSSFLVEVKGLLPARAAQWAGLFYGGITLGRFLAGFLTFRLSSKRLIRLGLAVILAGAGLLFLPGESAAAGMALMGLGCAPIFPAMIHETPSRFGEEHAQDLVGMQMASAYVGSTLAPALLGLMANGLGIGIYPWYLLAALGAMIFSLERVNALLRAKKAGGQ